jgi:hypothetical protein
MLSGGGGKDPVRLTRLERERITDGFLSIQSAENSLSDVDEAKVPELDDIHDCLRAADKTLRRMLRFAPSKKK